MADRVGIYCYATGAVSMSVCVKAEATRDEVEEAANRASPTGIDSRWHISEDATFRTGEPNPCPCQDEPGRFHYLLNC